MFELLKVSNVDVAHIVRSTFALLRFRSDTVVVANVAIVALSSTQLLYHYPINVEVEHLFRGI